MSEPIERLDVDLTELESILDRIKPELNEEEYRKLHAALETLLLLTQSLEKKNISIKRLRELVFGATSEKTKKVLDRALKNSTVPATDETGEKKKPKGHGRNGADAYQGGGPTIEVEHDALKPGDECPKCPEGDKQGKLYPYKPRTVVRLKGQAPVGVTLYELEQLRCNLCGTLFTADAPADAGTCKCDPTVGSMIALMKYGNGFPNNRLDNLQRDLGVPLPASTQWDIVKEAASDCSPAHEELIRQAAQGEVLHNDDTNMTILSLLQENQEHAANGNDKERTGMFTSGIVSTSQGQQIAVFFTGRQHAGENLTDVLRRRISDDPPIQMCDGLARNLPAELETIVSNCLAHGRRKFVDVFDSFPDEVEHLLIQLRDVYKNDAFARTNAMTPDERLRYHQANSGPIMDGLEFWLTDLIEEKKVEPNSSLGEAIQYVLPRWKEMTVFLRRTGAPLDNNICERMLKKVVLHRKGSYFYKTQRGADVGDLFMSLIATCQLMKVNPFNYLTELQRNAARVKQNPADWMPWNYRDSITAVAPADTS